MHCAKYKSRSETRGSGNCYITDDSRRDGDRDENLSLPTEPSHSSPGAVHRNLSDSKLTIKDIIAKTVKSITVLICKMTINKYFRSYRDRGNDWANLMENYAKPL